MPGGIVRCKKCKAEMRYGYSEYAIEFAAQKRGVAREEMIAEFYELNPSILAVVPEKCTKCGSPKSEFERIHAYA